MRSGILAFRISRIAALVGLAGWAHAQVRWQTTHTNNENGGYNSGNCQLTSASLRVKVHPAFLDVEEDVEIGVVGTIGVGNDANSLEIVGDFALPAGSAVTGALLWDGPRILQGRLLAKQTADSLYESLVDRNSVPPPRPRDPLLVEKLAGGGHRFRIYPVALGHSRHMRLRYQLPPLAAAEGLTMPLTAAVTSLFAGTAVQVAVTFENGSGTPSVIFGLQGATRTELTLPRTRLLTPNDLKGYTQSWDQWGQYLYTVGLILQPPVAIRQAVVKTSFSEGQMAGNYLNLVATLSQEALKGLNITSATSLTVVVRNAGNAYDVPVASCSGDLVAGCGNVVFNGKSKSVWSDSLEWQAFNAAGKLIARTTVKSKVLESPQDTGTAVLWAASASHFSEQKELPLGPVFGFVDEWASLLSMPSDSIGPSLAAFYDENGVPRISNSSIKDVVPNYASDQVPNNPNGGAVDPNNPGQWTTALVARLGSLGDPAVWRVRRSGSGISVAIPGLAPGMDAKVELFDLSGKLAGYWSPRSQAGSLTIASGALRPGIYVLKIRIAGKMSVKRIAL
ncbi:MAG: T9SS type A sorting domain-containing protein [Fibrobacteria bacterium]